MEKYAAATRKALTNHTEIYIHAQRESPQRAGVTATAMAGPFSTTAAASGSNSEMRASRQNGFAKTQVGLFDEPQFFLENPDFRHSPDLGFWLVKNPNFATRWIWVYRSSRIFGVSERWANSGCWQAQPEVRGRHHSTDHYEHQRRRRNCSLFTGPCTQ